jgi:hypothetical protein
MGGSVGSEVKRKFPLGSAWGQLCAGFFLPPLLFLGCEVQWNREPEPPLPAAPRTNGMMRRTSRVFQSKSVPDIAKAII